jgi:hypothetical protein
MSAAERAAFEAHAAWLHKLLADGGLLRGRDEPNH